MGIPSILVEGAMGCDTGSSVWPCRLFLRHKAVVHTSDSRSFTRTGAPQFSRRIFAACDASDSIARDRLRHGRCAGVDFGMETSKARSGELSCKAAAASAWHTV